MNYKATGIVRRIDDLGRVVIPKEIRRTMRLSEGDPMELFMGEDGSLKMKRYSAVASLGDFATEFADSLAHTCDCGVIIVDKCEIIVTRNIPRVSPGTDIGATIAEFINRGEPYESITAPGEDMVDLHAASHSHGLTIPTRSYYMYRIGTRHDEVNGAVVLVSMDTKVISDNQKAQAELAATFMQRTIDRRNS